MATVKSSDQGWFYHSPMQSREPTGSYNSPAISQIPLLSGVKETPGGDDGFRKLTINETDSKYIQLCKQGGRSDLIAPKYPTFRPSEEPVQVARSDWFYLEDNAAEERAQSKAAMENGSAHQFQLPEYLVHDTHKPFGDSYDYDNDPENLLGKNRSKRIGRGRRHFTNPQPSQVNLDNDRPDGYGVRLERDRERQRKVEQRQAAAASGPHATVHSAPAVGSESNLPAQYGRRAFKDEPYEMSKLMSYGYQKDAVRQRAEVAAAAAATDYQIPQHPSGEYNRPSQAPPTEYNANIAQTADYSSEAAPNMLPAGVVSGSQRTGNAYRRKQTNF